LVLVSSGLLVRVASEELPVLIVPQAPELEVTEQEEHWHQNQVHY
jgi:hypothetical protein